jgi:hypothetical protein
MVATRLELTESDQAVSDKPVGSGGLDLRAGLDIADDGSFGAESFSEEELAQLALAADPDAPIEAGAVPWSLYLGQMSTMLPQWYMPPAVSARRTRWRTALVLAIVLALVMIDAWGLCSTYGSVVPA